METDMSNETVHVRNTKTGRVGEVPRRIFEHPVLSGGVLVEVEKGSKSYIPEMYRPRTPEEYIEEHGDTPETPENESEDAE